jgi:CcmD family protein
VAALFLAAAWPVAAQAETLREQTLGRPYWFVFLAYAITLVLILGWVVSIARRLRRVETRLQSNPE